MVVFSLTDGNAVLNQTEKSAVHVVSLNELKLNTVILVHWNKGNTVVAAGWT